jgi:NitT/TauT family transport system permease protein
MLSTSKGAIYKWGLPLLIVIIIFLFWEIMVFIQDIPRWLLPPPSAVITSLIIDYKIIFNHTWITLLEVVLGFVIALSAGFLLASVIGISKTIEKSIYPFLIASQTIPIIVIAPMLLVWVGYGLLPKVIVVALISFFPIVVNTSDGMRSIDGDMEKLLLTMGAHKWHIFFKLRIPTSIPYLLSGMKVAMPLCVIGAVIGEWVGSSQGLGYLMIRSKPQFQTELVFAAILILSIMGITLFLLVGIIERLMIPWLHDSKKINE